MESISGLGARCQPSEQYDLREIKANKAAKVMAKAREAKAYSS